MPIDAVAANILSRGWYKEKLEPKDCEYLLTFRDKSSESNLAVSLATRLIHAECKEVGQICAEVQISSGPCSGNCSFCKYCENTSSEGFYDMDEDTLRKCVERICAFSDVKNIKLTTCADADIDSICRAIEIAKDTAKRGTRIFVDTKDLDEEECRMIKKSGAFGAFHACRIGEGKDTQIKPDTRIRTIQNLKEAGLAVITGLEPIGPETDPKVLVKQFFDNLALRCNNSEIIAREPIVGTPFNQYGKIQSSRFSQIRAILTLASSWYDPPIRTTYSGTYVIGSSMVTARFTPEKGKDQIEAARRKLFNSGFVRLLKADDSTVDLNLMYLRQTGSV